MSHVSDMLHTPPPPSCKEERRRRKFENADRAVTGRKREKEKRRVVRMFRKLFLLNRHELFHQNQVAERRLFTEARFHGGSNLREPTQYHRLGVDAGLDSIKSVDEERADTP